MHDLVKGEKGAMRQCVKGYVDALIEGKEAVEKSLPKNVLGRTSEYQVIVLGIETGNALIEAIDETEGEIADGLRLKAVAFVLTIRGFMEKVVAEGKKMMGKMDDKRLINPPHKFVN